MNEPININVKPLHIGLKSSFKQASSVRNTGESIWVTATRNNCVGHGEGCPRIYVTGENVDDAIKWLESKLPVLKKECVDLSSLRA